MGSIINIGALKTIFTIESCNELLPLILKITVDSMGEIKNLMAQIEGQRYKDLNHKNEIEEKISKNLKLWENKIKKLGAKPKGLWTVDFDSGTGYFCWKYPEKSISHFHGYDEGFSSRKELNIQLLDSTT